MLKLLCDLECSIFELRFQVVGSKLDTGLYTSIEVHPCAVLAVYVQGCVHLVGLGTIWTG